MSKSDIKKNVDGKIINDKDYKTLSPLTENDNDDDKSTVSSLSREEEEEEKEVIFSLSYQTIVNACDDRLRLLNEEKNNKCDELERITVIHKSKIELLDIHLSKQAELEMEFINDTPKNETQENITERFKIYSKKREKLNEKAIE